jgi:hypothetical protein
VAMKAPGKTILIIGYGVLGGAVLDFLAQSGGDYRLHVGGRDAQKLNLRVNLARYTAMNLGAHAEIKPLRLDLMDVDRTAETLAALQPDIIFNASTLHSWWVITQLPPTAYQRIDRARGGPWTPMHLVLARRLMMAVHQSGIRSTVVNASYPDIVNPALSAAGLAPAVGIGNICNAVPGIKLAVAHLLGCPTREVDVRFFAQHYVSYRMPSTGSTDGAPYHLTVLRNGEELPTDRLDHSNIFALVAGAFRRVKGIAGQSVTASSATAVLRAIADDANRVVHAPGPCGLPGGYPVRLDAAAVSVELPSGVSVDSAIRINNECQKYDGIEAIDGDGTVRFTAEAAGIMREELGYDCDRLPLAECEDRAEELARKYAEYRNRVASLGQRHAA